MQALDRLLGDAEARDLGLAIHYVDVDRFKDVNDTLGHDTGDDLVREIGRRLQAAAGEADVVARIGGDEFALVQRRATRHEEVIAFAERLIARVAEPCVARGHEIAATASIGTLWMPPPDEHRHDPQRDGGVDAVLALKRADIAMYKAKSLGRNRFCVFDPSMDSELQERRRIEQRIRHAVLHDGFDLHFQPLFDASDRSLTGFEALLRLPVGDGTTISPAAFIPVAEDMGLISTIGAGVLLRACEAARHWPEPLRVAVNLSPAQFADGSIVAAVRDALQRSGLAPHRLELEITEGLLLTSTESVMRDLAELKAMGTAIVMDDFGTGYSSLSYLWRFPFDKIKIDRSFIGALNAGDETVRNIVRTIVSLGRSLRMRVTAEGVETDGQANYLSALACDQLQGFLLGRPVPQAEVAALIRETQAQRAIERAAQADRGHPDRGHAEHGHSGHARFPDGHSEPEIPGDANAARRTQSTPV
jgi:diguanylate cyclase (GGDEF)-like protein